MLFPSNTFPRGPPKRVPSAATIVAAKRACAETIVDAIPEGVRVVYLAKEREGQVCAVEGWLNVFGDGYLNRHFVFGVLELCLVRLLPELGEKGPKETLEERISALNI